MPIALDMAEAASSPELGVQPASPEEEENPEPVGDPSVLKLPIFTPITDRTIALNAVTTNGLNLMYLSGELRADSSVVSAAVKQCGVALQYASDGLRGNEQIVMTAFVQNPNALEHAATFFLADVKIMKGLVGQNPDVLRFASQDIRSDKEIVGTAVSNAWWAMRHASVDLRSDQQYLLETCRKDGRMLRYASDQLRCDYNVVMASVRQFGTALQFASEDLRFDYEIVMAAVKSDGMALRFAHPNLRDDEHICVEAVLQNLAAARFFSTRIHKNPTVMACSAQPDVQPQQQIKNGQAAPPEIISSPNGYVEYRKPRFCCWPVVLCAARGGDMLPDQIPTRKSRTAAEHAIEELCQEVWNEFGKGRLAAPALVSSRLHYIKMDPDAPRRACCEDACEEALEAWDMYHSFVEEALQICIDKYGFAVLLDLHGQNHRRLVTELGYLIDTEELLLMDGVLDFSTKPTSIDFLLYGPLKPSQGHPGALSTLLRGEASLGGLLENKRDNTAPGFPCTPSPTTKEPVESNPFYRSKSAQAEATENSTNLSTAELAKVTYNWEGYTLRRYGLSSTVPAEDNPIKGSWTDQVVAIQLFTSWIGVRDGILERRLFGEHLCWAVEKYLELWLGWLMPLDERG